MSKPKSLTDRVLEVTPREARLGVYVLFTGPDSLSRSRQVELRACLRQVPTIELTRVPGLATSVISKRTANLAM